MFGRYVPVLSASNFTPEISDEMLELIRSQSATEGNEEELLQVGWEVIGTIIDVRLRTLQSFSQVLLLVVCF